MKKMNDTWKVYMERLLENILTFYTKGKLKNRWKEIMMIELSFICK